MSEEERVRAGRRAGTGRVAVAVLLSAAALVLAATVRVPTAAGAFTATTNDSVGTVTSSGVFRCTDTFATTALQSSAYFEYPLAEASAAGAAADSGAAANTGTYRGTRLVDSASPMACPSQTGSAMRLNGVDSWLSTANKVVTAPNTFSLAVWLKATTPADSTQRGGFVMGLSQYQTAGDGQFDRFLYIGADGRARFGVYLNTVKTMASTAAVDDGAWHQLVATVSATSGAALYVDGQQVTADATMTGGQSYGSVGGYWRIGWRSMAGSSWPSLPGPAYFAGSLRFAAAYPVVLSAAEVAAEYRNGKPQ